MGGTGKHSNPHCCRIDKYGAHAWLLSPPCQPYTRQGLQKQSADARAFSFIKILEHIPHMLQPPQMLFVENVVGFETSDTHEHMIGTLGKIGFVTQEFILSPLQFGIPYSRPRYFCLAKRKPLAFCNPSFNNQLLWTPSTLLTSENIISSDGHRLQVDKLEEPYISCEPIRNFLETQTTHNHQPDHAEFDFCHEHAVSSKDCEDRINNDSMDVCSPKGTESTSISTKKVGKEFDGSGPDSNVLDKYIVPLSLIERWGNAMDIVCPDSKRCCCFTKSYYRYVKGTGSLLATSDMSKYGSAKKPEVGTLKKLGLRYFTPREVANLHAFPEDFGFPPNISIRQQYALLGNSLSIAVVAPLLRYLFTEPA